MLKVRQDNKGSLFQVQKCLLLQQALPGRGLESPQDILLLAAFSQVTKDARQPGYNQL